MQVSEEELSKLDLNKQHMEKSNLYNIDKLIISIVSLLVQILIIYFFLYAGGINYLFAVIIIIFPICFMFVMLRVT